MHGSPMDTARMSRYKNKQYKDRQTVRALHGYTDVTVVPLRKFSRVKTNDKKQLRVERERERERASEEENGTVVKRL